MGFYDINVTKKIIKSNGIATLGPGGTPVLPKLTIGGILEKVGVIIQGTPTYTPGTGTIARDIQGGYNVMSNMSIIPNQQVPIVSVSGFGNWLFNTVKEGLELDNFDAYDIITGLTSPAPAAGLAGFTYIQDALDPSWVNSSFIIAAPSGNQAATWSIPNYLYTTQRMFNGIVGYWELGNPLAQLTVSLTPSYSGAASPFNIYSATAGVAPYFITGNATVTLATPQADIVRYLFDTPVNPQDRPPVTFINTILEDSFQNSPGGATQVKYTFQPLSGYIARVVMYVFNSTTSKGVDPTLMLASNSLQMNIGDGTSIVSESIYETALRQKNLLGFDLPRGAFFFDFLGRDLTWQEVYSTYDTANINAVLNFSSALGASSTGKVIKQVMKPLQYVSK
jgi:hypothetical protein